MPSERPRWAMLTRPVTKSGSSRASEANSSMTISSRGIGGSARLVAAGRRSPRCPWRRRRRARCSRRCQLRAERDQRALDEVGVEVGDHADGVRQVDAVLERRPALVVDQHEGQRVGPVGHRERRHERLQQLGLAGARRTGDQRVRTVAAMSRANGPSRRRPITASWSAPPTAQLAGSLRGSGSSRIRRAAGRLRQDLRGRRRRCPDRRQRPRHPREPPRGTRSAQASTTGWRPLAHAPRRRAGLHDNRGALLGEQPLVGVQAQQ